jgi:hypothetical protein
MKWKYFPDNPLSAVKTAVSVNIGSPDDQKVLGRKEINERKKIK